MVNQRKRAIQLGSVVQIADGEEVQTLGNFGGPADHPQAWRIHDR